MKTANLKSLITIYDYYKCQNPDCKTFQFWDAEIKCVDLEALKVLLLKIDEVDKNIDISWFNDFFISYSIPQIGKEFDLLRIADDSVINIELKSEITTKIKYQLVKNKYYLKFLGKEPYLYTYTAKENKLFKLLDNNDLVETNLKELTNLLKEQSEQNIVNQNLDNFFKPSNYLISPFSKTEEFINNEYFLTKEQEEIEIEILKSIDNNIKTFLITGSAGSGKTLLTYHIAKKLHKNDKKVAIIHMGNLNSGHEQLKEGYSWNIQPIKYWKSIFQNYIPNIIIIDEVQRANNKKQFEEIINKVTENKITLIMSGDKAQTLRNEEGWAIEWENINKYALHKKIRTNKEIASFITVLLNLNRKHHIKPSYKNINVVYFKNLKDAKQYILSKENDGYNYISYTPNTGNYGKCCELHRLNFSKTGTAHQVIGQEFEKVITILDKNFYYNEKNLLSAIKVIHNPYSLRNMFFQQITRAINKLEIVVIENFELYNKIISIFENGS